MKKGTLAAVVTEDHKSSQESELNSRQENAISMLLSGHTHQEIATALGVTRETVSRWVSRNPFFQAELNQRRLDLWRGTQGRLKALTEKALDVLEDALSRGDTRVALEFLKRMPNEDPPNGPMTPDAAIDALAFAGEWAFNASLLDTPQLKALRKMYRDYWMPGDSHDKEEFKQRMAPTNVEIGGGDFL